jgi:hypothetical protein
MVAGTPRLECPTDVSWASALVGRVGEQAQHVGWQSEQDIVRKADIE